MCSHTECGHISVAEYPGKSTLDATVKLPCRRVFHLAPVIQTFRYLISNQLAYWMRFQQHIPVQYNRADREAWSNQLLSPPSGGVID